MGYTNEAYLRTLYKIFYKVISHPSQGLGIFGDGGLVADVVSYLIDVVATNFKCTITTLPFENFFSFISLVIIWEELPLALFKYSQCGREIS
ncbi:hypothetical protein NDA00_28185 [Funiculus sociatus GB2-M2]|uniref:hypothetical protein n=1 Tax=Trichocoleus sp. FACHB-90 TaxID=2692876 RepID=UPI001F55A370|nr:hypothetical protein [Trichocoleus sp. FACHB-90]